MEFGVLDLHINSNVCATYWPGASIEDCARSSDEYIMIFATRSGAMADYHRSRDFPRASLSALGNKAPA